MVSAAVGALSVKYRPLIWIVVLAAITSCLIAFLNFIFSEETRERTETAPPSRERTETAAPADLPPRPERNQRREAASPPNNDTAQTDPVQADATKGAPLQTAAPSDIPPLPLRNAKRQAAAANGESEPVPSGDAKGPQTGQASWYDFHGQTTANGDQMDRGALTAAHNSLPLGSKAVVENLDNGREVEVRINDRGPFAGGRIIDLSKKAAEELGMLGEGLAKVEVKPADAAPSKQAKR
jgi:peptidoglycan lytic transglycosylase